MLKAPARTYNAGRLRLATSRFLAMLIREAKDITGFSNEALAEALNLEFGTLVRYSIYPPRPKTRAPLGIAQRFENKVAGLLRRASHPVVIECTHESVLQSQSVRHWYDLRVSNDARIQLWRRPSLQNATAIDFELTYGDSWPTYDRVGRFDICKPWSEQPELVKRLSFQWGWLWDESLPYPPPEGMRAWQDEHLRTLNLTRHDLLELLSTRRYSPCMEALTLAAKTVHAFTKCDDPIEGQTLQDAVVRTVAKAACRMENPAEFLELFASFSTDILSNVHGRTALTCAPAAGNLPE